MSAADKRRIVLSVLSGEVTIAEAARRNKVSERHPAMRQTSPVVVSYSAKSSCQT